MEKRKSRSSSANNDKSEKREQLKSDKPEPIAVDTKTAATMTGIPAASLASMRVRGGGPKYSKIGQRVVYRVAELDAWLESRGVRNTADAPAAANNVANGPKAKAKATRKRGGR